MSAGATSLSIEAGGQNGRVSFPDPIVWCEFPPDDAMNIARAIAGKSYAIRHGKEPDEPLKEMAQQMKSRATDQIRDRMIARVALNLPKLIESGKSPGYIAMQMVDWVLREVA